MLKLNQKGFLNPLMVPLVIAVLVLLGLGAVSAMFYSKYTDERDNNQPKIEAAVEAATEKQKAELETDFKEREKQPNRTFITPAELGSVKLTYPKTWSIYVVREDASEIDVYMHPGYVPSEGVNYALRMNIVAQDFATTLEEYDSAIEERTVRASAIKKSNTTGARLDGVIEDEKQGSLVLFPLRDKTLKIWTESTEYRGDFNNTVLKNLTFAP